MSAHNPDQDEFDPSLEEGIEEFGYEEGSFEEGAFPEDAALGGDNYTDEAFAEESFGDEEFGDEESADESWDDNFDEGQPPAKKKGGLFNIAVIALAVLGGGGFIYMKVLAPNQTPAPQTQTAAIQADSQAAEMQAALQQQQQQQQQDAGLPAPAMDTPTAGTPDGALPVLSDPAAPLAPPAPPALDAQPILALTPEPPLGANPPEALPETTNADAGLTAPAAPPTAEAPLVPTPDQVVIAPETTAVTTPTTTPAADQPMEVTSAPPMPAPISAAPAESFNAGLPSARDIMIAANNQANTPDSAATPDQAQTQAAAPASSGISADAAKSIEQKLSVLITRLDTFEGRIANLESGLHQVSGKISALESKPAAAANLDGVNNALKSLEDKMAALEKSSARSGTAPVTAAPISAATAPSATTAPAASTQDDVSKIDKPTFVPAAPETPKAEPAAPKPAVKATEPARTAGWILKSAQPGTAMVVPRSGGDMRTVRVGDTLSGLGRITAIEQRGSKWVVQGTQGTLTH